MIRLVTLRTSMGNVGVNPAQVTLVVPTGSAETRVSLSGSGHIDVQEEITEVVRKLTNV